MATTTNSPASPVNPTTMENPSVHSSTTKNQPATVNVHTTKPLMAPCEYSKPLISERLIIRTYTHHDFLNYYSLDSQPEPNILGRLNREEYYLTNFNDTLIRFSQRLEPWREGLSYGIFIKKPDGQEDDYIGDMSLGGNVVQSASETSWPILSYKLKKEYWGKGYGTEAVKTFTSFWWSLPRVETLHVRMDPSSIVWEDYQRLESPRRAFELITAYVEPFNKASLRVLQKAGFEIYKEDQRLIHLRFVWRGESTQPIREKYKEGGRPREV